MKKVWMGLFLLMMTLASSAYAKSDVAALPAFDVTFNGQKVESVKRQFPLLVYKDITYIPMTYYDCRFMGLATVWDDASKTLDVFENPTISAYGTSAWHQMDGEQKNNSVNEISICEFNIIVNGKAVDNSKEEYPLILFRNVTYFPLTWRFASDEFGWEYSFAAKSGLSITSDNYHCERVFLENADGDAITDGKLYYYSGIKDGKKVIYRAETNDTKNPIVIHEIPDSPLSGSASFMKSGSDLFATYFAGYSGVTGSQRFFKIAEDGTVSEETPNDNYSYGKHGYHEIRAMADGIKVIGAHHGIDGKTEFSYEKNGTVYQAEPLGGWVRVGCKRNGIVLKSASHSCVQIFKNKIYYTAMDMETGADSALYCIDTLTGKNEKLLDGVCGFHVYNGWLNEMNADSTMIVYDNCGAIMRYSELDGKSVKVTEAERDDMFMACASGSSLIYTVMQSVSGDKTVAEVFDCYASGSGSIHVRLIDTTEGAKCSKTNGYVTVCLTAEDVGGEIRTLVAGEKVLFASADVAKGLSVYDGHIMYRIPGDDGYISVDLSNR